MGHVPMVFPVSAAKYSAKSGVIHKKKGGTGLIFRVTGIHWIDDDSVDVDGGYYEGNLSSSGNTYRVVRRKGKWIVKGDTMHWIS